MRSEQEIQEKIKELSAAISKGKDDKKTRIAPRSITLRSMLYALNWVLSVEEEKNHDTRTLRQD
jgi:hypothetical protein